METLFFIVAKLGGALVRVDTWIVLGMALALFSLWRRRTRIAGAALACTLGATLLVGMLPFGTALLASLEARHPLPAVPDRIDGIVVLGGSEDLAATARWGGVQLGSAAERLTTAVELARRHPEATVLFAGGSGRLRDLGGLELSEAAVAARFFSAQGVEANRLLFEDSSRNTAENARRARSLADPMDGEVWVLVTSAFHMPRAVASFAAAGWPELLPWPVDYRSASFRAGIGWNLAGNLQSLNTGLREHLGLQVYARLRQ